MVTDGENSGHGLQTTNLKSLAKLFNHSNRSCQSRTDSPMNQSKLYVNTGGWRKAREIVRERVTTELGCTSDWIKKWRELFVSQSWSAVLLNYSQMKSASTVIT